MGVFTECDMTQAARDAFTDAKNSWERWAVLVFPFSPPVLSRWAHEL